MSLLRWLNSFYLTERKRNADIRELLELEPVTLVKWFDLSNIWMMQVEFMQRDNRGWWNKTEGSPRNTWLDSVKKMRRNDKCLGLSHEIIQSRNKWRGLLANPSLMIIITTTILIVLSPWPRSLQEFTRFIWTSHLTWAVSPPVFGS